MIFEQCDWCEEAERVLAPLIEPEIKMEFMNSIATGAATLWRVSGDGFTTWLVTRVEKYLGGHVELVLEVIAGKKARDIVSALMERVKPHGVHSIRFETHHPEKTASRLIGSLGFERQATVFRVSL